MYVAIVHYQDGKRSIGCHDKQSPIFFPVRLSEFIRIRIIAWFGVTLLALLRLHMCDCVVGFVFKLITLYYMEPPEQLEMHCQNL